MRYLLDTHTFIWFMSGDEQLPANIISEIKRKDNDCCISIASLWEISVKIKIGKLEFPFENAENFLLVNDINILPVYFSHLRQLLLLDLIHRDPFDRIIIAQGISENLTILTKDKNFKLYPCKWLW